MKKMILGVLAATLSLCSAVGAQFEVKLPAEALQFVESGAKAIAYERADLNGDGKMDAILVLHRAETKSEKDGFPADQRPLLILTRGNDGKLSEAKRNDGIVMCSECGGIFGDPFAGITIAKNTFTVNHYGGSAWRWQEDYKFNYSRSDRTWQLVKIDKLSFHTGDPRKTTKRKVLTPPKDFGKIDFSDFDPSKYEGVSP